MSGSDASWSSSNPPSGRGTPTPIECIFADNEDKEFPHKLRRFLASRLMNMLRYESLVEALSDESNEALVTRLEATLDMAQHRWAEARQLANNDALVRLYNRANPLPSLGKLVREDAQSIDNTIAEDVPEDSEEPIHWTYFVARYMDEVLPNWHPWIPKNETEEDRRSRQATQAGFFKLMGGHKAFRRAEQTTQQILDMDLAERLDASTKIDAKREVRRRKRKMAKEMATRAEENVAKAKRGSKEGGAHSRTPSLDSLPQLDILAVGPSDYRSSGLLAPLPPSHGPRSHSTDGSKRNKSKR